MTFISVADVPALLKDWSNDLNSKSPNEVPAKSLQRFFWTSSICGHIWTDYPRGKNSSKRGCRICSNDEILAGYNDFVTIYRDLATELKNIDSVPKDLHPGSNVQLEWVCSKQHTYTMSPSDKRRNRGCPYCAGRKTLAGFNDLATTHPHLVPEWNEIRNGSSDWRSMNKTVTKPWWICSRGHEWQARIDARTGQNQGCPYCSGSRAIPGETDLATKFPKISADWDYTLNGDLDPTQFKPFAHKFVWWKCPEGHSSYRQQISKRTGRGTECPECSKGRGNSKGEFELAAFIMSLGYDYIQGSRKFLQGMEVDLFVESGRRGLEYNGEWTHCNEALKPEAIDATFRDYHLRKLGQVEATGVDLVFVWEHDWEEHRAEVELAVIRWFENGERDPLLERLVSYKDMPKTCCDVRV